MTTLIGLAILPAIVLMIYIYKMDKREKEPVSKLIICFVLGMVSVAPVAVIELFFGGFLEAAMPDPTLTYYIIDNFLVVALVEEFCKYFCLSIVSRRNKFFDCLFDGIVYSVFVSLGFATLENILYSINNGVGVAVMRMFSAVPGHMCFAIFMGYYYSRKRRAELYGNIKADKHYSRMAVIVPTLIHGMYDLLATLDSGIAFIGWIVLVIVVFFFAFKLVKKASKNDEYLIYTVPEEAEDSNTEE